MEKWDSTILTNVLKFKNFINPLLKQFVYFTSNKVMVQKFFTYISKCVGLSFPSFFNQCVLEVSCSGNKNIEKGSLKSRR